MKKVKAINFILGIFLMICFLTMKSKTPIWFTCPLIDNAAYSSLKNPEDSINYPVAAGIPVDMYVQMR